MGETTHLALFSRAQLGNSLFFSFLLSGLTILYSLLYLELKYERAKYAQHVKALTSSFLPFSASAFSSLSNSSLTFLSLALVSGRN